MAVRDLEAHDLGLTWTIDERSVRAAHALADGGRVWLVDPIDEPAALERVAALGEPVGVVQLLDRHNRDCAAIAERLGIPHLKLPGALPGSPFECRSVLKAPGWKEVALWWPERRGLVVAEAVGTINAFTLGSGAVGVHPLLRLLPPGALRGLEPEHLLVGHGPPVHGPETARQLADALDRSRRDTPKMLLALPRILRGG